jgi:hypothetical protein
MSIKEVTYYVAVCDCCGESADYGDYSAWADSGQAFERAEDWVGIDGEEYCETCWRWPTDEEAEASGSDDPVRSHGIHPAGGTDV